MVASNPLLAGKWSIKKFNATVINDIWAETLFFTLVATVVYFVSEKVQSLAFKNSLLGVLGTVLGLVISFRTSSAYERYQEGRKLWSGITLASRNLGQFLWIHVPVEGPGRRDDTVQQDEDMRDGMRLKAVIEKKSMINLVQAFSVSVKHFLRSEPGIYYEDLYPLVSFLPRHTIQPAGRPTPQDTLPMWGSHDDLALTARSSPQTTPAPSISSRNSKRGKVYDPEKALPHIESDVPLRGSRIPPKLRISDYIPFAGLFRKKEGPPPIDSNVPLEITLFLSSYVQWLIGKKLLDGAIAGPVVANISALQDAVTALERVATTPIPFAYQAHLRMSLWIYLFFLPSQLYDDMSYLTIPATCFASFLLLGFLEIGQEIENPFNYDENDLDMDGFCFSIQRELHEITAHPAPHPHTYIFSSYNQPLAPTDRRTADEMVADLNHEYHINETGMDHVRRTLLKNWKEVENDTRFV